MADPRPWGEGQSIAVRRGERKALHPFGEPTENPTCGGFEHRSASVCRGSASEANADSSVAGVVWSGVAKGACVGKSEKP